MEISVGHYQEVYHMCNWNYREGKNRKNVKEIITEKYPNLMKIINPQFTRTQ